MLSVRVLPSDGGPVYWLSARLGLMLGLGLGFGLGLGRSLGLVLVFALV